MNADRVHRRISIHGLVQGVSFRAYAATEARRLGLTGFVRNNPDGYVEIAAEGVAAAVDQFVAWCHEGSPAARVDRVDLTEGDLTGFTRFEIRR